MSKVNFVSEFNMFMRYARDNSLSLRERMLWIALFYVANDRATYNEQTQEYEWPDGYIQVSNNELNLYCCLDKRAVETLRNTLKQRGLIDFIAGQKNKRNPAYKINYLSVNVGYKIVPNPPPNNAPNDDPNTPPFYKYNIESGINAGIKHAFSDDEEDGDDPADLVYARVRERVQKAYQHNFGALPTTTELDLMTRCIEASYLGEVATEVINTTASASPRNRLAYLREVCNTWAYEWIRTEADLIEYMTLEQMGRKLYQDPIELYSKREEERSARKAKYTSTEESA